MKIDIETTQVGVAGEYLVAGELSLRGYLAAITLRNTRGTDIIASTKDGKKSISIQVKSNRSGKADWMLNKKSESFYGADHFYVFVTFKELKERARFFIVPSKVVADTITKSHKSWLKGKKRNGEERKDTPMRRFRLGDNSEYEDAWDVMFNSNQAREATA